MASIRVRALPDRVVYDAPRGGKRIPSDKFVSVQGSNYIRRLIEHWGDVELEGEVSPKAKAPTPTLTAPAPKPAEAPKA